MLKSIKKGIIWYTQGSDLAYDVFGSFIVRLLFSQWGDVGSVASPSTDSRGSFFIRSPFEHVKRRPVRQKMSDFTLSSYSSFYVRAYCKELRLGVT